MSSGLKDKTVIIQGFGNVGYWTAKYFSNEGAKIVGIVEHHSAIYNPNGFEVDDVKLFFMRSGTLFGYPKSEEEDSIDPM